MVSHKDLFEMEANNNSEMDYYCAIPYYFIWRVSLGLQPTCKLQPVCFPTSFIFLLLPDVTVSKYTTGVSSLCAVHITHLQWQRQPLAFVCEEYIIRKQSSVRLSNFNLGEIFSKIVYSSYLQN